MLSPGAQHEAVRFVGAAQAPDASVSTILVLIGVLLVVLIAVSIAVVALRRRLLGSEDASAEPLTLHQLRSMHERGELADDEFEKAKRAIVGAASQSRPAKKQ